jgi:hypothetical protein
MTYDEKKKRAKRQIKRDPATGYPVKWQLGQLIDAGLDTDYLDEKDLFDPNKFNTLHNESCDLFNTTSMAALTAFSTDYFKRKVLPQLHTYEAGPIKISRTNSIEAGAADFGKQQAAKQSDAGKQNSDNIRHWGKTNVSSGGFND